MRYAFVLLSLIAVGPLTGPGLAAEHVPPNIVLILADDLGYGDLHCYNPDSKIPTPHLDRLAKTGIRFTDAHSPSTVCTPTRYSLLTGQMAFRNGMRGVFTGVGGPCLIKEDQLTLPQMLKNAGYRTACIGKWHVGMTFFDQQGKPINKNGLEAVQRVDYSRGSPDGPIHRGFDEFFGTVSCPTTDWLYAYMEGDRIPNPPTRIVDRRPLPKHAYSRDNRPGMIADNFDLERVDLVFLEKSKSFLKRHLENHPRKPFFLFHSMQAVHLPSFPAKEFQGKTDSGPHGDFVFEMDYVVGQIVKTLEELKVDDNTLIIFSSDNGPETTSVINMRADHEHDGAKPWRGMKRDNWEGGHRVPLIAHWPGKIKAGGISHQTICLTDMMATLAAINEVELPHDSAEDSFNMLPALLDPVLEPAIRPITIHQTISLALAVRQGRWKYLDHRGSGGNNYARQGLKPFALPERAPDAPGQLYDLSQDPGETNNLYFENPDTVKRLKSILDRVKRAGRSAPPRDAKSRQESANKTVKTDWGRIEAATPLQSRKFATIQNRIDTGIYPLPTPFANLVKIWPDGDPSAIVPIEYNRDASQVTFDLSRSPAAKRIKHVNMICAEKSAQLLDGTIVLSALDAKINGKSAQLETNPGNHRIGFWTNINDSVHWDFKTTRWGKYDVEVTYALAGKNGSKIEVSVGDETFGNIELRSTESWYRYQTVSIGSIYLPQAGNLKIQVRCQEKRDAAVMNLKAVILHPAFEGKQKVMKEADGGIRMHSRNARVLGTLLRYEPKKIKQTLGYWAQVSDQAEWQFAVEKRGRFSCEVLQGCGKGQGGSRVSLRVYRGHHGEVFPRTAVESVEFVVEDTGHFQNFKRRSIGSFQLEPGNYRLRVVPIQKAKNAVMDLRQVDLLREK